MKQTKITTETIERVHDYIEQWYDHDSFRDFNMAWDSGYTDLACYIISDAIDSSACYDYAIKTEKIIERLLKKYTRKQCDKDHKECFGHAITYVNPKTNEHAFISNGHVDYLMTEKDMLKMGFINSDTYYDTDSEDCHTAILEGFTMCGDCSVPYCSGCSAMTKKQCNCGPIADNE